MNDARDTNEKKHLHVNNMTKPDQEARDCVMRSMRILGEHELCALGLALIMLMQFGLCTDSYGC